MNARPTRTAKLVSSLRSAKLPTERERENQQRRWERDPRIDAHEVSGVEANYVKAEGERNARCDYGDAADHDALDVKQSS